MLKSSNKAFSSYTKREKIGEGKKSMKTLFLLGTFAVVYTGVAHLKDKTDTVKIAIKKIKAGLFTDGLDMSAIREIKYLKALKHLNIVKLFIRIDVE